MEQLPLFVFGTLRRGQCNHHYLEGRYQRVVAARLRDFGLRHPLMIVRRRGGVVEGELYFLQTSTYATTLSACDRLEGIPPGETAGSEYRRLKVVVETATGNDAAWAYVDCDTPELPD